MNLLPFGGQGLRYSSRIKLRIACIVITLAEALLGAVPATADSACYREVALGRRMAAEVERHSKVISGPIADRVNSIGSALAQIATSHYVSAAYGSAENCSFRFRFKVIENRDVNAFSLPGGYIYVNTGLLELIESDDELAGVLAHEISHAAHHHALEILKAQRSIERYIALATFAGILGNARGSDIQHLLVGAQFIRLGRQSRETLAAEEDADKTAVEYVILAGYNPQGYIDFLRKLDRKQQDNPGVTLGILQTHPLPHKRITYLSQMLAERGIKVTTGLYPEPIRACAVPADSEPGSHHVFVADRLVITLRALSSGMSSKERAEQVANRINRALESGMLSVDFYVDNDTFSIATKEGVLLTVEPEDAPVEDDRRMLLSKAKSAIDYAIWAERVRRFNCVSDTLLARR